MSDTPQRSNSSGRKKKWQPTASTEAKKLGFKENDWNLPGPGMSVESARRSTRSGGSRGGGRRLEFVGTATTCLPCGNEDGSIADGDGSTSTMSSLTDTSSSPRKKYRKPPASRVIVDVKPVVEMLESFLTRCPKCGASLSLSFPTTCVASSCRLECTNIAACTFAMLVKPSGCSVPLSDDAGSALIERNTDYAINVLFVLSHLNSGNGGTEAARLLGLLGLPNSTTMQSPSFGGIEKELAPVLFRYAEDIMFDNLKSEVKLVLAGRVNDNGVSHYQLWLEKKLDEKDWPRISGCADMGWQQKGSGRRRNSKSGHALVIAMLTRKAVAKAICSKACGFCKTWTTQHTQDEPPPDHDCHINHQGSSGSMEPIAILQMYKDLYNKQVIVERFVADDDSSMKAKLKWSNETYMEKTGATRIPRIVNGNGNLVARPNHGGVPGHMPEPSFVADPNHRTKTLTNLLYALKGLGKTSPEQQRKDYDKRVKAREEQDEKDAEKGLQTRKKKKPIPPFVEKPWNLTMTSMDVKRISRNFAFMARTLQYKETDQQVIDAGKSVLEHHFDNHEYCGVWCKRKIVLQRQQEDETAAAPKTKFYREKVKDALLYDKLKSILARFITLEALKEIAHSLDTCANESFNNTVSWVAPKNKVYSGTDSLSNRVCIALGITALGTLKFYEGLFERLGITMTSDVWHYLTVVGRNRKKRLDKCKTVEAKKKRKAQEFERLKRETAEATTARAIRDGQYKPGIGMTGGYDVVDQADNNDEDDGDDGGRGTTKKKRPTAKKRSRKPCRQCGGTDHQRTSSRLCKFYTGTSAKSNTDAATAEPEAQANAEAQAIAALAEQMDTLDEFEFVDDAETDVESLNYFSANSEFS